MTEQHRPDPDQDDSEGRSVPATVTSDGDRVVVVTPDGMGVASHDDPPADENRPRPTNPADLVEQPAKVMRIGSMIKQLLDEVRSAPLDEAGRARLREIHQRSIAELEDGLAPELVEELERLTLPFEDDVAERRRAADRPGPAGRLARRAVPRHPDRAGRAADGGAGPAAADAPAAAGHQPPGDAVARWPGDAPVPAPDGRARPRRGHRSVPLTPTFPPGARTFTFAPVPFRC